MIRIPAPLPIRLLALAAAVFSAACGEDPAPGGSGAPRVAPVAPSGGLPYAFVDVAQAVGYTMRNRSGKVGRKEFIIEAMPPGIAVADFDGDGWMDMYCPNGNDVVAYDRATREVTLLPQDEAPRNALYMNRPAPDGAGRRFVDRAAEAGVDDPRWAFGAVAGDVDNDGDTDLYVCNWGRNLLYLNRGDGTFEAAADVAGAAGDAALWSTGACLFDYDADGDLDLYVANYADMLEFFDREDLVRVAEDGTLSGRSCEWKGLDVYCGPIGLEPQNDLLLRNLLVESGTLRFEDVSERAGITYELEPLSYTENSRGPFYGFQPIAWDIDGDGHQDVFVANDSVANTCWMNAGDGTFTDRALEMGLALSADDYAPQASMGVGMGDLTGDGEQDLVVTEFSHDQFNLLVAERLPNGRVAFEEKAAKTGMRDITFKHLGWGAVLFDPDHDGDLDIFFACGHVYPEVDGFADQQTTYRQSNLLIEVLDRDRPRLRDVSALAGPGIADVYKASRAAVAIDFDNDGDCDIATTELNDTPCLLRCDLDRSGGGAHWLRVRLRGNPAAGVPLDPAGAVVTVEAGGRRGSRVLAFGTSFQSSEDPRMHFGLGDAAAADAVEVAWPNGTRTRLEDVAADQVLEIRCPD